MKKILSIGFVLMLAISLTACGETKEEKVINNIVEKSGEKVDDQTKEIIKDALNNSKEFQDDIANTMSQMPKIIKVSKSYQDCLESADTKNEAIECYQESDKYADELGIIEEDYEFNPDEEFGDWTAEDKTHLLTELKEDLKRAEQFIK